MRERRALFLFAVATCSAAAVVAVACGTDTVYVTQAFDAGDAASARDARRPPVRPADDDDVVGDDDDDDDKPADAGKDAAKDASADARAAKDANGPGAIDDECAFNHECRLALRCECDGECACKTGTRGKNKLGASCDGGNQCANALCIEGTNNVDYFCSDECNTPADCPATLPRCQPVSFVGRICVRQP